VNFLLLEMTYLRYFMPLIIEGNKRDEKSIVFWRQNAKYNNPKKFLNVLKDLSSEYEFELKDLESVNGSSDITFMVEGMGLENVKLKGKKVSLTFMIDFSFLYHQYIGSVDKVILPSEFMAQYHNTVSDKNLYLGSPKYDVNFNKEYILKKYELPDEKIVTVFAPNTTEIKGVDLEKINRILSQTGYKVVTKTRGKWYVHKKNVGDFYFEDYSWYPHASMELIEISDFIVNFDSSVIKESVMLDTPVINFGIRGDKRRLPFLYDLDFCSMLKPSFKKEEMLMEMERISGSDHKDSFKRVRNEYLFERGMASKKIVDLMI